MSTTVFKTFITGRQAIVKIFSCTIAIASVATMVLLAGCSARRSTAATTDEGVVINGVRWATRNADGFRTFVASPEMMGGFYARLINRARDRYTLRRATLRRGGSFRGNNFDPCPPGWRMPTEREFRSLIAAGSVWTTVNGVYGRLFGTAPNQLFLPAAGKFVDVSPRVRDVNEMGYYLVDVPRMIIFCQENIDISPVHSFTAEGLLPRRVIHWGSDTNIQHGGGSGFGTITILPELSVRCVAVTADD